MDDNQQELTHVAFLLADLEVHEAWLAYFAYGGNQDLLVIDAYLNGLILRSRTAICWRWSSMSA